MRALLLAALVAISGCAATAEPGPGSFSFGLFGDMPYFEHEHAWTQEIIREMGGHPLAFVVHDGDIKRGGNACTDAIYQRVKDIFDASPHPLVFVPGDNEWADCVRNGGDPLERLARVRQIFLAGDESLGARRIRLERQSADARYAEFRENVRWAHGGVLFVALNVPGGNNNLDRGRATDAEFRRRDAANRAWLSQSFEIANRRLHRAVVVVFQANPHLELPRTEKSRRGYLPLTDLLEDETIAFGKPVLLVHGDTHYHRIDKPMRNRRTNATVANLTRVETFGSPLLGWVKATFDPNRSDPFVLEPFRFRVRDADAPQR